MFYQIVLAIIAPAIDAIGFFLYIRSVLRGHTKPHSFTWFVWGLLQGVTFFAQLSRGGGVGTSLVAFGSTMCFVVFGLSLFKGERSIARVDIGSLVAALAGIALWIITSAPLTAVVLAVAVDIFGFIPTFRKAYGKPYEETIQNYTLGILSFAISIFALQAINLVTVMFPATLVVADSAFVSMVLIRRKVSGRR